MLVLGLELEVSTVIHETTQNQKLREPGLETKLKCAYGLAFPQGLALGMHTGTLHFCHVLIAYLLAESFGFLF